MAHVLSKEEWIKTASLIRSIDADYDVYVERQRNAPLLVQLSVAKVSKSGILLTATDYLTHDAIEVGLTFDEAYARKGWMIVSNYWPISHDVPATAMHNPREYTDRLIAIRSEIVALRDEESTTTDRTRYEVLTAPNSPIRNLERKADTLRMLVAVSFQAMFGFWPSDMERRMGGL